jgi:hypothetical protein
MKFFSSNTLVVVLRRKGPIRPFPLVLGNKLPLHVLLFQLVDLIYVEEGLLHLPQLLLLVRGDDSRGDNQDLLTRNYRRSLLTGDYLLAGFAAGAVVAVAFSSLAGLFAGLTSAFLASTLAGAVAGAAGALAGSAANAVTANADAIKVAISFMVSP